MRESFLRDIERTLRPGGSLHFWTDVEEYFQTSLALLAAHTTLLGPAAGARDPRRARHGLPHPLRAPRPPGQRAGVSGGVQEGVNGWAVDDGVREAHHWLFLHVGAGFACPQVLDGGGIMYGDGNGAVRLRWRAARTIG